MAATESPYSAQKQTEAITAHVLWMTTGLSCEGDSVAMTSATNPSLEDIILQAIPGMPKVQSRKAWEKQAERMRAETLEKVVFRGEAAAWRDATTKVEWLETIPGGPGYHIRKLRYEALLGNWQQAMASLPLTGASGILW